MKISSNHNYLQLKKIWKLTPSLQIVFIILLFIIRVLQEYFSFQHTGRFNSGYPPDPFLLFAPIYEEIIFRNWIFLGLQKTFSIKSSAVLSCLIFGIWHLKNIFYLSPIMLVYQILYAGLFIGPILTFLVYKTKSVWPGVVLHFLNNAISPLSWLIISHI